MKQIIRNGTFETNSSSTHALIFCTEDEYQKLQNGELWLSNTYDDGMVTEDRAKEIIQEVLKNDADDEGLTVEELKKKITDEGYYSDVYEYLEDNFPEDIPVRLEDWYPDLEKDTYTYEHKGERIKAICAYGWD